MKRDEGSIEIGSIFILFFLSAILGGAVLFSSVTVKYFDRYSVQRREKDRAVGLLYEITGAIQPLKNREYDHRDSDLLDSLKNRYRAYNLEITDLSSGYHLDFLSDDDLEDSEIASFLFVSGNAAQYIGFRNSRGISTDREPLKPFIRQEAWDSCVSYGWINLTHTGSYAFRQAIREFGSSQADGLFPLVNGFPLINVNTVDPDMLAPLITRPAFKIEKPDEKMRNLKDRLMVRPVSVADISSLLNISVTNPIFSYLGTKTAFWGISLRIPPRMRIEAVLAAIPDRYGERQDIDKYVLIDRSIQYEPR
jgi:hypothetical protein